MTVKTPYTERTAIVTPLLDLFKSRRFLVALAGVIVAVILALKPELGSVRDPLITLITLVVLVVVGGYTVSDAATAGKDAAALPAQPLPSEIKALVKEAISEVLPSDVATPSIALTDAFIDKLTDEIETRLAVRQAVAAADNSTPTGGLNFTPTGDLG